MTPSWGRAPARAMEYSFRIFVIAWDARRTRAARAPRWLNTSYPLIPSASRRPHARMRAASAAAYSAVNVPQRQGRLKTDSPLLSSRKQQPPSSAVAAYPPARRGQGASYLHVLVVTPKRLRAVLKASSPPSVASAAAALVGRRPRPDQHDGRRPRRLGRATGRAHCLRASRGEVIQSDVRPRPAARQAQARPYVVWGNTAGYTRRTGRRRRCGASRRLPGPKTAEKGC
jgi:hypothetical protein